DMKRVLPTWEPYFGLDAVTHHMPNRNPIGPVAVWMPFYLVGCALGYVGKWTHLLGSNAPDSPFHAWVAGRGGARLGSTLAVWATPIAWYAVTQPFYQHGAAFMLVAILVERWDARVGDPD